MGQLTALLSDPEVHEAVCLWITSLNEEGRQKWSGEALASFPVLGLSKQAAKLALASLLQQEIDRTPGALTIGFDLALNRICSKPSNKWVALLQLIEHPPNYIAKCSNCGNVFPTKRSTPPGTPRFCSNSCRTADYKLRKR